MLIADNLIFTIVILREGWAQATVVAHTAWRFS